MQQSWTESQCVNYALDSCCIHALLSDLLIFLSFGVDAFVFDWSGEFCLLAPPLCLISTVILHVCISR